MDAPLISPPLKSLYKASASCPIESNTGHMKIHQTKVTFFPWCHLRRPLLSQKPAMLSAPSVLSKLLRQWNLSNAPHQCGPPKFGPSLFPEAPVQEHMAQATCEWCMPKKTPTGPSNIWTASWMEHWSPAPHHSKPSTLLLFLHFMLSKTLARLRLPFWPFPDHSQRKWNEPMCEG